MTNDAEHFDLSPLEAEILVSIDHVGWYGYLWFPVVYREVLNFGSDATDEAVYAAFSSLIRKKALTVTVSEMGCPDWEPAPDALNVAKALLGP